jgi:polyphosphate kinase 2 (PPK2 family)
MDLESYRSWYAHSQARQLMLKATDTKHARWYVARSDDKRRARLNCISYFKINSLQDGIAAEGQAPQEVK